MFTLIEPNDHRLYPMLLDSTQEFFKGHPTLKESFQDLTNATFIVHTNESQRVCGGALLLKQNASVLHKKVQKSIDAFALKKKEVWTCTLFLQEENNYFACHTEFFFDIYYRNLYKKIIDFGTNEKADFLYMTLVPGEYLCTEIMGCWPYVFEIKPQESSSGLFHGVLSFKRNSPKNHRENRIIKFPMEKSLAA
ncbi:MAG: hypothetical protein JSR85_04290 [Proteobacteria bacterium]|nr:hypothetical protein [Pseudomonadota bacterium]